MELLYFILGALFIQFIIPILDGAAALILTWFEVKKADFGEHINAINVKIRETQTSDDPPVSPRVIGFTLSDEYEEEDEDDEN